MNPRWLFKMARWSRNPPSTGRVIMVFSIIALCLVLFGVEKFIGWPEWMTVHKLRP